LNILFTHQREILALFERYWRLEPMAAATVELFNVFVRDHPECCERSLVQGHLTGSAWLVSADEQRVLLTHHRKLDRWLQLGGHADGDSNLADVAQREAEEESGLAGLQVDPDIFDLDRHRIPARGDDPEHWHYDVRFVVRAQDDAVRVGPESLDLAWRDVAEVAADDTVDASLRRMARKWLRRQGLALS